ncbi:DUF1576 domain-containing protein [Clostridium grantii]|uniref:DUF1576 domain-containing protein n=1 Tax=Clostridium grantii DSM 8605 TaxID=1121316 RepID=A0A1M5TP82_9CLOT|nr:DUF1576 domain-containing protein [Clostridium grantii]SHH52625.1 Protein of unknown function [Clostridium grantii DSM 8605]
MQKIKTDSTEIEIGRIENLIILSILPIIFLISAFLLDTPANILKGLYSIIISSDVLLVDYLEVGGIGATFVNAALLALINIFIIYKLKLKLNGALIAAIFTITGFSFFGKNIFNVWPIYIGGYLYAKYQKIEFKSVLVVIMFSTSLAPIINEIAFGLNTNILFSLPIAILFGIFIGFVITPLSSHMLRTHDGYNLYNIGLTAGILGMLITSLLRSFGFVIEPQQVLSTKYDLFLKIFFFILFLLLIILGYFINNKSFKGYKKILKFSGRLVTDFTQLKGYGITYINMGIMGIVSLAYAISLGGVLNGPIVGALLTVVGFGAFGKHLRNALPIMLGVALGAFIKIWDIDSTAVILAGLFGTTLAPIAGEFGPIIGLIAGFLHLSVVMNVGVVHGGINLYNNGFAGGFVAAILVPIIDAFKKGD